MKREIENLRTCVTEQAELSTQEAAQEKQDFNLVWKISNVDLRAAEARYHESCRRAYVRDSNRQHHGPVSRERVKLDN